MSTQSRASATANANSKVLRVGMIVEDRARDSIDQINAIGAVVDEWRDGVSHVYTRGADVSLLTQFLATLPPGHHERPGVIRAIEVLRAPR